MSIINQMFPSGLASLDGKIVIIKQECPDEKVNRLKLDARRILGLERDKQGYFIKPPPKGSDTWKWAKEMTELKTPVIIIWVGYPKPVSLKDLKPVLDEKDS